MEANISIKLGTDIVQYQIIYSNLDLVETYRSIQGILGVSREALQAKEVKITVDVDHDEVRAVMEDNGIGFDSVTDLDPSQGEHDVQALNAIRERIELVDGTLGIFSGLGESSRFEIKLPIIDEPSVPEPDFFLRNAVCGNISKVCRCLCISAWHCAEDAV